MNHYGTVADATTFFAGILYSEPWDDASDVMRFKALVTATRDIDKLNFEGQVSDPDQTLSFPRAGDTLVPQDIEYATYELANSYLDGIDAETEFENLGLQAQSFSGTRTQYDSSRPTEHIIAGIPNRRAWNLLVPYLRDPRTITISRS